MKSLGSINSTARTAAQTDLARFWTANPIATWYGALRGIATAYVADVGDNARLFALASLAAADGQMTVYESKHFYNTSGARSPRSGSAMMTATRILSATRRGCRISRRHPTRTIRRGPIAWRPQSSRP